MIEKILLIFQEFITSLPGRSPGKADRKQKVTAVGDNNIIIIIGDNTNLNLILPKDQNNVKRFPTQKPENHK